MPSAIAIETTALVERLVEREVKLQRLVTVYIVTGLLFMLLPGTFLGVWNLISISGRQSLEALSPAWLQAHGHAQIFGWIGTFVLGIGFYSLSKMARLPSFAIARGWTCYGLWTSGLILRWAANVTAWEWRILLPVSAALELAGFLTFFLTLRGHRPAASTARPMAGRMDVWIWMVAGSTMWFLITLVINVIATVYVSWLGTGPALPHKWDQRMLMLPTWGFLVPAVWGFNARWLPVFLGLRAPDRRYLLFAFGASSSAVILALAGFTRISVALLPIAATAAILGLGVFERSCQPPKTTGIHPSFPVFIRGAYVWLMVASVLSIWAASSDRSGGIWGASRHALTVGFISTMVFAIGQRILPAFCGGRVLFSKKLMFASLLLLNLGCLLRVASEIPAYEGDFALAWSVLPVSAVTEMAAVTVFALNLMMTFASRVRTVR